MQNANAMSHIWDLCTIVCVSVRYGEYQKRPHSIVFVSPPPPSQLLEIEK